ncbi:hypothetical protein E2562_032383 [Oryza meyeriana var. granulata]|uniref:Uncharacterized protein n=1 Tax=Oryza meyeriana var. granulata TaxID=110450 RepID=A0A6G1CA34_9ORYZ|nr:hypothetical protein E2562_032383 [Oryza meyeriana var. granulata]
MVGERAGGEEVGSDCQSHREGERWGRTMDREEMAYPPVVLGPWTRVQCGARRGMVGSWCTATAHGAPETRACRSEARGYGPVYVWDGGEQGLGPHVGEGCAGVQGFGHAAGGGEKKGRGAFPLGIDGRRRR